MTEKVAIGLSDGSTLDGALALPSAGTPPWPGVIVLFEAFGMTPEMHGVADRFAREGYAAVLPDLFSVGSKRFCLARALKEVSSHQPGTVTDQIASVHTWLASRDDVDASRLGVIGFCLGGGLALMFASTAPDGVGAASVNYGDVPPSAASLERVCPIVGSYGGRDRIFAPKGRKLARLLAEVGVDHDVKVYDNAGHSFLTEGSHPFYRIFIGPILHPGYVPDAADDAWGRIFAFFDTHVRGSG